MEEAQSTGYYNIDAGRKMSIATSVERGERRYAIMRSSAPRFGPSEVDVPFGAYNTDTAHRKTLVSNMRDSRRFYSSAFQSKDPRFRPGTSPMFAMPNDLDYNPDVLKNARPATVSTSLERTPIQYSIHRSRYRRFADKPLLGCGVDVVYDTDTYPQHTLHMAVEKSPFAYSNVRTHTSKSVEVRRESYAPALGPGVYDFAYVKDVRFSPCLVRKPLSSLASTTRRFNEKIDATKGLGSTWRPEQDAKSWHKGTSISKAPYLRPQYLPKSYAQASGDGH